jgi:hypothetical protein
MGFATILPTGNDHLGVWAGRWQNAPAGVFEMNVAGFPTLDKTLERLVVDASTPDIERRRREGNLKTVRAISAFEGVQPSKFAEEQAALCVNGDISSDEMCDRVVQHWTR